MTTRTVFIKDGSSGFRGVFTGHEEYANLMVLPAESRPAMFDLESAEVQAWIIKRQQADIDADVDKIYRDAIGDRTTEYTTAEAQAIAYRDAGYAGSVPACVSGYAVASGLTPTQAANGIIAQAAAWRGAVELIRAKRLKAKADLAGGVAGAKLQWDGFVKAIRAQLGI